MMTTSPTALKYSEFSKFFFCRARVPGALLALLCALAQAEPQDPNVNGIVYIDSINVVEPLVSGETTVEVNFDIPVVLVNGAGLNSFGARKSPIVTSTWTTPILEDLNGDQKPDLVIAEALQILVHLNVGEPGELLFEADGRLIATRTITSSIIGNIIPRNHLDTAITFGDADNDGDRDLICSEKVHGNVLFFPLDNLPYHYGDLRVFGAQRVLRYNQVTPPESPVYSNIAVATQDGTSTYLTITPVDEAMATAALIKYDSDDNFDLLVTDNIYAGSPRTTIFWVYCFDALDPQGTPVYKTPFRLAINGQPAAISEYTPTSNLSVSSFADVDGLHGLDLVVSLESGVVFIAKSNGQVSAEGYPQFSPFTQLAVGGSSFDAGLTACAVPVDADRDGDLDLITSTLTNSGPIRRLIQLYRNSTPNTFANLSTVPSIIGTRNDPMTFSAAPQNDPNFKMADFNNDSFLDIVQGLQSGEISINFSVDTGDNFDPVFASPVMCRNISGEVFKTTDYTATLAAPRVTVYDSNMDQTPEGLIIASGKHVYYSAASGIGTDGSLTLQDPVAVAIPSTIGDCYGISLEFGDFVPADTSHVVTGAVIFRQGGFGSAYADMEVYWAPLTSLSPPVFGAATLVSTNFSDFSYPYAQPCLWDLDNDGDLDMVSTLAATFCWVENTSGPGAVASLANRAALVEALVPGENRGIYRNGAPSVCIFKRPSEPYPLLVCTSKRMTEPQIPFVTRVHQLVGLKPDGYLHAPRYTAKERVEVVQTLPSKILQTAPDRVKLSFPLEMLETDEIAVNKLIARDTPVSFRNMPITPSDADGDGLPDQWELDQFGDLDEDGSGDGDGDKYSNLQEFVNQTSATAANNGDSEPDGLPDGWELFYYRNLASTSSSNGDGDWLTDKEEYENQTSPLINDDVDLDGWLDRDEFKMIAASNGKYRNIAEVSPWADEDGDGCSNEREITLGIGGDPFLSSKPVLPPTYLPMVQLDSAGYTHGNPWSNGGWLSGSFIPSPTAPVLSTHPVASGGTHSAVTFKEGNDDWFAGPHVPAGLLGAGSRTVMAWIFNPGVSSSQADVVVSWGADSLTSPTATLFSCRHSTMGTGSAFSHSGSGELNAGWGAAVPNSNQWQFVVYRYDQRTGARLAMKDFVAGVKDYGVFVDTGFLSSSGTRHPIILGAENDGHGGRAAGVTALSIGELRIYAETLPISQIKSYYEATKNSYGVTAAWTDTDSDGVPNSLETSLGTNPADNDSDNDRISDGSEFDRGTSPLDFYDGKTHLIQITSGNFQSIFKNKETPLPIVFKVTNLKGEKWPDAVVDFTASAGGKIRLEHESAASVLTAKPDVLTNSDGEAKIIFKANP